jgi:hypothetical protein
VQAVRGGGFERERETAAGVSPGAKVIRPHSASLPLYMSGIRHVGGGGRQDSRIVAGHARPSDAQE